MPLNLPRMNKHSDPFRKKLIAIAALTGIPGADITSTSRREDVVSARQALQYVVHTDHHMHPADLAIRCGTQRNAINHNIKRVKELLEVNDPTMMRLVAELRAA